MRIDVTAENIRQGHKSRPYCCPVALAMKDAGLKRPYVGGEGIAWTGKDKKRRALKGPKVVLDFAYSFDLGEHVEPFSFKL